MDTKKDFEFSNDMIVHLSNTFGIGMNSMEDNEPISVDAIPCPRLMRLLGVIPKIDDLRLCSSRCIEWNRMENEASLDRIYCIYC